jgi:hypothetical protein
MRRKETGLYYVAVPSRGYQEFDDVEDARRFARDWKKEDDVSLVRVVDALDRSPRGYRIMFQFERDSTTGKWHASHPPLGRGWI